MFFKVIHVKEFKHSYQEWSFWVYEEDGFHLYSITSITIQFNRDFFPKETFYNSWFPQICRHLRLIYRVEVKSSQLISKERNVFTKDLY